jgi:hypothetical protein
MKSFEKELKSFMAEHGYKFVKHDEDNTLWFADPDEGDVVAVRMEGANQDILDELSENEDEGEEEE